MFGYRGRPVSYGPAIVRIEGAEDRGLHFPGASRQTRMQLCSMATESLLKNRMRNLGHKGMHRYGNMRAHYGWVASKHKEAACRHNEPIFDEPAA